jgi:hypothetical protein
MCRTVLMLSLTAAAIFLQAYTASAVLVFSFDEELAVFIVAKGHGRLTNLSALARAENTAGKATKQRRVGAVLGILEPVSLIPAHDEPWH